MRLALPRSENEARNVVVTGLYVSAFVPNCDRECWRCQRPFLPCLLAIVLVGARIANLAVDHYLAQVVTSPGFSILNIRLRRG